MILEVRPRAELDLYDVEDFYPADVFARFREAFTETLRGAALHPGQGSPVAILGLEHYRRRRIDGFPFGVYYRDATGRIVIVRVLHDRRDLRAEIPRFG